MTRNILPALDMPGHAENCLLYTSEKPDENSGVRWFALRDVIPNTREPEMRVVYQKLMDKCDKLP